MRTSKTSIEIDNQDDSEKIKAYTNFDDGRLKFGDEEVVNNYLTLAEDPIGKHSLTEIRSSTKIENLSSQDFFPTHLQFVLQ